MYNPDYYQKHKKTRLAHNKRYRQANREIINKKRRDKYWKDSQEIRKRNALSYQNHHEKRIKTNRTYRNLNKEELNYKRRINLNIKNTLEPTGYDIHSLRSINDGLAIHLNNDGLGNYQSIYRDFYEHFRKVLTKKRLNHWDIRFSLTGFNSGILIYFNYLEGDSNRKKLRGFLSFYKRLLEREIEK